MKFYTLLALLFCFYTYSFDRKGYYITNTNTRVEGKFKSDEIYTDYFNTPFLKFKVAGGSGYISLPTDIKEYGVGKSINLRNIL